MKVYEVINSTISDKGVPYFRVSMTLAAINQLEISMSGGSLGVLNARLFDMPYYRYLKMARDVYGATLVGRTGTFIIVCYKDKTDAERMARELNKRAITAMAEHLKLIT